MFKQQIHFDILENEIRFLRHDEGTKILAKRKLPNIIDWLNFRVELTHGELTLWTGDNEKIALSVKDKTPIEGKGHIGIRAWGGAVRTDMLKLHLKKHSVLVDEISPMNSRQEKQYSQSTLGLAKRRALKDLCSVMFNISEFLYVD